MPGRDDFAEFVVARQAALLRTAYLLTGHAQDAEDLVQTTLMKGSRSGGGSRTTRSPTCAG